MGRGLPLRAGPNWVERLSSWIVPNGRCTGTAGQVAIRIGFIAGDQRVDRRTNRDAALFTSRRMTTFIDDDRGYLTWIAQHPGGFVLNTGRKPTPEYLILHLATCSTISGTPARGQYWTKDLIKHCSEHRAELRCFARVECRGEAQDCGIYQP
ncbi:MAG TPA: hypothetical protein VMV09_05425 [Candidatus Saccharimonadales bacterium]|nr:hypothetical protein [Candidatus Saccharimonadales bacterium]